MAKIIKYILVFILLGVVVVAVIGVLFSIGHAKMQSIDLKTYPKELLVLEDYIKNEFQIDTSASIYDLKERGCSDLYGKENTFYKENFNIYINEIKAVKYSKDTVLLDKKIDSIAVIVNQYLPRKQCHDSISIYYYLNNSVNKTHYHDMNRKYKIE